VFVGRGVTRCTTSCYTWYSTHSDGTNGVFQLTNYAAAMGINLGLKAASKGAVLFGDYSSTMGYCCATRCMNPPNMWQLGWATRLATITSATLAAGHTQTVVLPLADTAFANMAQIVASWLGAPDATYWVGYRGATTGYHGYDIGLPSEYANKINVYRWDGNTYDYLGYSSHLAALSMAAGSTTWSNSSLVVRVTGVSAAGASIAICRADGTTETSCGDGLDNDCDGLIDSADPDCRNDNPNTPKAVPATCALTYQDTIPANAAFQTSVVPAVCAPTTASQGGFYYSIGPFATTGNLTVITTDSNACRSARADTVLALYSAGLSTPTCIGSVDGPSDGSSLCAAFRYIVTAADVASRQKFLVRVGVTNDAAYSATFGPAMQVYFFVTCSGVPRTLSPSPSPILRSDNPNAAVPISTTCPVTYTSTIPANTQYQTAVVPNQMCGPFNSRGGLYFAIGPFPQSGNLQLRTTGANVCSQSDTVLALYNGTLSALACVTSNDDFSGRCSALNYTVTAADVASRRKFLIRVGLFSDPSAGYTFLQTVQFTAAYLCAPPPAPTPSSSPPRVSSNKKCASNGGGTRCPTGECCSRWGHSNQ
jgi:hypothetical protein